MGDRVEFFTLKSQLPWEMEELQRLRVGEGLLEDSGAGLYRVEGAFGRGKSNGSLTSCQAEGDRASHSPQWFTNIEPLPKCGLAHVKALKTP